MSGEQPMRVRTGIMSGIFYPDSKAAVKEAIAAYDAAAKERYDSKGKGSALALVVPHAGWELGGVLNAAAFRAALGRPVKNLVIIGPLHSPRENGIFLSDSDSFLTPLGAIPVAADLVAEIADCGTAFFINDIPHLDEYSIEIVLPFAQYYFPNARLVPILIGGARRSTLRALALALDLVFAPLIDETLFVVSTNASGHVDPELAALQAKALTDFALTKNAEALSVAIETGQVGACGAAACAALLGTRLIASSQPRLIATENSKAEAETNKRRIHYAAIAYEG